MNRLCTSGLLAAVVAVGSITSSSMAVNVTVDPAANWLGFMNVSNLPSDNGGAYQFGNPWGIGDLVATWSGPVVKLSPNSINDPSPYWYTPSGGPGAAGNKIMEANLYVEPAGSLPGQTVTFSGVVLSNTFTSAHTTRAFIRDFAPDYSSSVDSFLPLNSAGGFTLSLNTINDPARHVQYGFQTKGVDVWITDVAAFGNIQIMAPEPASLGALSVGLALLRRRR